MGRHTQPETIRGIGHTKIKWNQIESKSNSNRGIVYVETRAFNQHKEKILNFRRHILIPKKGDE